MMKVILGDVKFLTSGIRNFDPKTEVVVLVTNGRQVEELPIQSVTMNNKFVITCRLPEKKKKK